MKTLMAILSLATVIALSSCTSPKACVKNSCKPADCKTVCKPVRSN